MVSVEDVLKQLKAKATMDKLKETTRCGMTIAYGLAVPLPELRKLAKTIGKNHKLAQKLWKTNVADAKILATMLADPTLLDDAQMEAWVSGADSWYVADEACMNLFDKSALAWRKIDEWSMRKEEFVRRTAFSLLAVLAVHDKKAPDEKFLQLFPIFTRGADDERALVKKAVSWALRNIGKRNLALNAAAINEANKIRLLNSKSAHWIASDVTRELTSEAVQRRLKKKQAKQKSQS